MRKTNPLQGVKMSRQSNEEEQYDIARYILVETAKLDAMRQAAERTIGLLKERRAALIAAAVTGKIKSLS